MPASRDFRQRDPAAQAEARRIAVELVKGGQTRIEAAEAVGVNRRFVGEWVAAERTNGPSALVGKKRGRRPGEQKALTSDEDHKIRRLIIDKCPDQLKLPFALWTREAVAVLIERKATKRLSLKVVGRFLAAWNMTPQRPMRRALERDETRVQQWMRGDYPAIAARAKTEKAEIHWVMRNACFQHDETGILNQANDGRSYAPIGPTPVIPRPAQRFSHSMISSLTNRGQLRFMVYDGALNVGIFLRFLKRLVKGAKRKIFLILGSSPRTSNLRVHRAKAVMAWVEANKAKIELFFLPPYAPDCNRDELINAGDRQAPHASHQGRTQSRGHVAHARAAAASGKGAVMLRGSGRSSPDRTFASQRAVL